MTPGRRVTALLLTLAALSFGALLGFGCGGDDDDVDVSVPEISVETTQSVPTETTETATQPDTGGTGEGGIDPSQEDSATNDKPPEPGSPEEAFEQACEENPAACG